MPELTDVIIGRRLRSRRRQLDLTLQDVAMRVGVGFQQVQKYERATCRISVAMLLRFSWALDVDAAWFFAGLPDAEPQRLSA